MRKSEQKDLLEHVEKLREELYEAVRVAWMRLILDNLRKQRGKDDGREEAD